MVNQLKEAFNSIKRWFKVEANPQPIDQPNPEADRQNADDDDDQQIDQPNPEADRQNADDDDDQQIDQPNPEADRQNADDDDDQQIDQPNPEADRQNADDDDAAPAIVQLTCETCGALLEIPKPPNSVKRINTLIIDGIKDLATKIEVHFQDYSFFYLILIGLIHFISACFAIALRTINYNLKAKLLEKVELDFQQGLTDVTVEVAAEALYDRIRLTVLKAKVKILQYYLEQILLEEKFRFGTYYGLYSYTFIMHRITMTFLIIIIYAKGSNMSNWKLFYLTVLIVYCFTVQAFCASEKPNEILNKFIQGNTNIQ
ncbi:hypothetical protein DFJ63DRAFT_315028 [Scheffersomyces coipomensis]|uniref:uncharacterized protein n=1 Tax=Scheffersomyces coipomensis TaxID=1788519 RepID=UPI00315CE1A5